MSCSSGSFWPTSANRRFMRSSPDSQRVYRGVLLGLGGIARNGHLPAFQADPRVASRLKIVGIVDDAVTTPIDGIPLLSGPEQIAELGGGPIRLRRLFHPAFASLCTVTLGFVAGLSRAVREPVGGDPC